MPKATVIQTSFNAGELSPLLGGRIDVTKYGAGLAHCENFIPLKQGPIIRRPGTRYVTNASSDSSANTRLIPFKYSRTQAYVLELSNTKCRFYYGRGVLLSGGTPYEVTTPFAAADLPDVRYLQSGDSLLLTHPQKNPVRIKRLGHTNWLASTIGNAASGDNFRDGPYLNENVTNTTFTLTITIPVPITITASSTAGINNGAGFQAADIGRCLRIINEAGNGWYWGIIQLVNSTTVVELSFILTEGSGSLPSGAKTRWRLGQYRTGSWPAAAVYHEDRLFLLGGYNSPDLIAASSIGDYMWHAPSELEDGLTTDDMAIVRRLGSEGAEEIVWADASKNGILIGTTSSEWVFRASEDYGALTPTNAKADLISSLGSYNHFVGRLGGSVVFTQLAGKRIFELLFDNKFLTHEKRELTLVAEHMTDAVVSRIALQRSPHDTIWCAQADGSLISITYDKEQEVTAFARHTLAGVSDSSGAIAKVEDIAAIPNPSGGQDDIWVLVKMYVNGATKRFILYLENYGTEGAGVAQSFYVDHGLTYSGPSATVMSGLSHLEGQTVRILAGGASHPSKVVSGGSVTLDRPATNVHIGLGYKSSGKTLRVEAGSEDGTAQFKKKRIHKIWMRLLKTVGLTVGRSETQKDAVIFRHQSHAMGAAVPLFSGDVRISFEDDYDSDGQIYFEKDDALPATILAIGAQLHTQDE